MYDTFTLDVDQASELKHAAKRNGVTNADLKKLSSGDMFAQILPFLHGRAKIVITSVFHIVDTVKVDAQKAAVMGDEYLKSAKVRDFFGDQSDWFDMEVPETVEAKLVVRMIEQQTSNEQVLEELGEHAEINLSEMRGFLLENLRAFKAYNSREAFNFYMRDKHGKLRLMHAQQHPGARNWSLHVGGTGGTLEGEVWISRK